MFLPVGTLMASPRAEPQTVLPIPLESVLPVLYLGASDSAAPARLGWLHYAKLPGRLPMPSCGPSRVWSFSLFAAFRFWRDPLPLFPESFRHESLNSFLAVKAHWTAPFNTCFSRWWRHRSQIRRPCSKVLCKRLFVVQLIRIQDHQCAGRTHRSIEPWPCNWRRDGRS